MMKSILNTVPGLQSTALLGSTIGSMGFGKKNKNPTKSFMKGTTRAMVGIPLISTTAGMVNAL